MADEVVTVEVDAQARTIVIREKIEKMRELGYDLVGPELDLAGDETSRVEKPMTLTFKRNAPMDIGAGEFSGPQAGIIFEGGRFENRSSGATLDAGPL